MALIEIGAGHGFTAGDLDTRGHVAVIPAYQKVFFADARPYNADINDSGFHKLDMINTKLVGVASGAFTKGEVLTQATSGATGIFDESVGNDHFVYRTTKTQFDATNVVTGGTSGKTVTPSAVTAPPHWLNWILSDGAFPDGGSNAGCLYCGRIVLNSMLNPNQWFMTRSGDPLDLLVGQDDVGTPISSQNSKAGVVGDAVIGFVPYQDQYLLFGCANSIWVLRGDAAAGGRLNLVTEETGLFSPTSWCWDDRNTMYFIGTDGIYALAYGSLIAGEPPVNITSKRLPSLISDLKLNRRTDRVAMAYDKQRDGIVLTISQLDGTWSASFWYDLRTGGFFPETYTSPISAAMYYDAIEAGSRKLLVGCYDGYIRSFDDTAKADVDALDAADAIEASVTIGPIAIAKGTRAQAKINDMSILLSKDSDGASYAVRTADDADQLISDTLAGTATPSTGALPSGGRAASVRPHLRGSTMAITLSNTEADETFGLEKIEVKVLEAGKSR
jgi:hypothetical protein